MIIIKQFHACLFQPQPFKSQFGCQVLEMWPHVWKENHLPCNYFLGTLYPFSKLCCIQPFRYYWRPRLVPVFTNRKEYEEDFHFYERNQRATVPFSICFTASEPLERGSTYPEQRWWPCQAPSPRTALSISASSTRALNSVSICALSPFILYVC